MTTDQRSEPLRPCPHCGSPAIKGWCRIYCSKCPAIMHDPHDDEAAHVKAWNRRADLPSERPSEPTLDESFAIAQAESVAAPSVEVGKQQTASAYSGGNVGDSDDKTG